MADKDSKWQKNVAGKYYVDTDCIASKYCTAAAPNNFRMDDSGRHAFVYKQPENGEEEEQAQEAVRGCPVLAIGDDGDVD